MERTKNNIKQKILDREPLLINSDVCELLILPNGAELFSLLIFYFATEKWGPSRISEITDLHVSNRLHWNIAKVRKYKKQLVQLGFFSKPEN